MFQARTLLSAHRIQPKSNRSITVTGVVLHSLLIMYIITAHVSVSKVNAKKLTTTTTTTATATMTTDTDMMLPSNLVIPFICQSEKFLA